ncbi:Serine/threonine protein kinase [Thermomonospora echinospora]|uniref:non-specific serine/threonine protein kinase n=1 Tax=Thermomonospora echinospora TaxID=1992 RepID=A0A1H5W214_9ACTN|nr:serine/threonine-protein kinase [Thermomonospora echinospora]SEF93328.1 Serine/threonine protein kinase [Thermomonospora echinospora]
MAGTQPQTAQPGHRVAGRYRLEAMLGRGGMGTVWRARDEMLDREVAVKEVLVRQEPGEAERAAMRERTLREARATARLSHPGIVTVHDVVDEDDRPWIVMELVRSRSLQDLIDADGPLPPGRVAGIGRQMLAALRAAHAVGILHRDIKPANVLITDEGRAVLTDFGIARVMGEATMTQTGLLVGSPAYMPPERARGEPATPASDLWALGATLYAACEGRPPHERSEVMAVLAAVLTEDPPPPRNAGPLTPVLGGLLLRDPAHRLTAPQAEEMLARIAADARPAPAPSTTDTEHIPHPTATLPPYVPQAPDELATGPAIPPVPPAPPARRSSTNPGMLLLVGVLTTIALVLTFVLVTRLGSTGNGRENTAGSSGSPNPASGQAAPQVPQTPQEDDPSQPSAPSSASVPDVPPGLRLENGPGYRIGVPEGWRRFTMGNSVFWRSPDSSAYVQVDRTQWSGDPLSHWEQWESEVVAAGKMRDYRRIGLGRPTGVPYDAADLEFTWTNADGVPMHGIDRGVVVDGRPYAVFIAIPQEQWDGNREKVNNVLDTFRP